MHEVRSHHPSGAGLINALTGLMLLFLVSACTSARYPVSGPYLQYRDPVTGMVYLQAVFASSRICAVVLEAGMRGSSLDFRGTNIAACTDSSASSELPYQVTLREANGITIDIEMRTLDFCEYFISEAWNEQTGKQGSGGGGTAPSSGASVIAVPCGKK